METRPLRPPILPTRHLPQDIRDLQTIPTRNLSIPTLKHDPPNLKRTHPVNTTRPRLHKTLLSIAQPDNTILDTHPLPILRNQSLKVILNETSHGFLFSSRPAHLLSNRFLFRVQIQIKIAFHPILSTRLLPQMHSFRPHLVNILTRVLVKIKLFRHIHNEEATVPFLRAQESRVIGSTPNHLTTRQPHRLTRIWQTHLIVGTRDEILHAVCVSLPQRVTLIRQGYPRTGHNHDCVTHTTAINRTQSTRPTTSHTLNEPGLAQAFPTSEDKAVIHLNTRVKHACHGLHSHQTGNTTLVGVHLTRKPRLDTRHTIPLKVLQVFLHRVEGILLRDLVDSTIEPPLRGVAHVVGALKVVANFFTISFSELIILTRGHLTPREITMRDGSKVHGVVRQPGQHRVML